MWQTRFKKQIYRYEQRIFVYENWRYRWLTFADGWLQTCLLKSAPHKPVLEYISPMKYAVECYPGDCCLLGLGGGGLLHALQPKLPGFRLDAVEIDAEVIRVAQDYFMLPDIKIIQQDANDYIEETTHPYQHILVDLFDSNQSAMACYQPNFFQACYERLLPKGILAINVARACDHYPVYRRIRNIFQHNTLILPIPKTSNIIILAGIPLSFLGFLKQCQLDLKWGMVGALNQ